APSASRPSGAGDPLRGGRSRRPAELVVRTAVPSWSGEYASGRAWFRESGRHPRAHPEAAVISSCAMSQTPPPTPMSVRDLDDRKLEALIEMMFLAVHADGEFSEEERGELAA